MCLPTIQVKFGVPKGLPILRKRRDRKWEALDVCTVSTADLEATQTLSQQLMSPREEGKMQGSNNGRRDKEKGWKMEPKIKIGNAAEGEGESKIKRIV